MTTLPTDPIPALSFDPSDPMLPGWPKVVGMTSIIWGALGLLCNLGGIGCMALVPMFMASAPDAGELPPTMRLDPIQLALGVAGTAMTIFLIVAGVATRRRRPVGQPLHLAYAAISLPLVIAGTIHAVQKNATMVQWAQDNPASPFAKGADSPMALIITAAMGILFTAYPVFLLIWFGAVKRHATDLVASVPISTP